MALLARVPAEALVRTMVLLDDVELAAVAGTCSLLRSVAAAAAHAQAHATHGADLPPLLPGESPVAALHFVRSLVARQAHIAAGAHHSAVVTRSGQLLTFGE